MMSKKFRSLTCTARDGLQSGSALKICLCSVLSASPFRVRALVYAVSVLKCQWFPFCFLIIASARPGGGFCAALWSGETWNLAVRRFEPSAPEKGDSFSHIRQRCNQVSCIYADH